VFLKVREVGPENIVQFLKVREVGQKVFLKADNIDLLSEWVSEEPALLSEDDFN
jgi:hypothetical protein